jgi:hypothetical protein
MATARVEAINVSGTSWSACSGRDSSCEVASRRLILRASGSAEPTAAAAIAVISQARLVRGIQRSFLPARPWSYAAV